MLFEYRQNGAYAIGREDPQKDPRIRYSVMRDEAEILAAMAKGKRVLEIGTGLGVATRWMAMTADSVTTVDVDPWVLENVTLPPGVQLLEDIPTGEKFDLIFVDGDHSHAAVLADIDRVMPVLARGGTVVFHDYGHKAHPGVASACAERFLGIARIPTENGLGIYRDQP